ncbi:MAG: hypothetical protein ABII82_15890 [Verrucomicrobiota bacterium]
MHRFIPAPDDAMLRGPDPEHTAAVKRWTRETLGLDDEAVVTMHETACVDPGCPLVECIITVFADHGPTRRWRFTRPRAALTKLMVRQTLATPPETGGRGVDATGSLNP